MIHYFLRMQFVKNFVLISIVLLHQPSVGQDIKEPSFQIQEVVTIFQHSIENKDSVAFNKLFFSDSISFIGIMSAKTEESIKKNYPEFEGVAVSNSRKFIREICNSPKKQVEKIYNVDINTDGIIATVSFDYSFHSNNVIFQWGFEKWNLVFVDNTWLITDVIYTIRFPKVEPFSLED
jgi:hypothetical protein